MQAEPSEKQVKTGYSVLRVKEATRERFEQIMQQTSTTTQDEMLTLLMDCYTRSRAAEQQKDDTLQA